MTNKKNRPWWTEYAAVGCTSVTSAFTFTASASSRKQVLLREYILLTHDFIHEERIVFNLDIPLNQWLWDRKHSKYVCESHRSQWGWRHSLSFIFFPLKLHRFITMASKGHIHLDLQTPLGSCTSPKHKFVALDKPNWKSALSSGFFV